MATAINQMNRFLPSFITLVVGVDSETEGSAIGATLPSEGRTIRASHSRFWQRKVLHLCCGVLQCDTDAGTNQLGVMEPNLIALAFKLLQQMKNSDSNDFKIHK